MVGGNTRKVIVAGAIGNVLEWYDFAIYGYFAAAIGRTFFPKEDEVAQILSAFGIFAVGFLMRPVGGAVVGHIGDKLGRRAALTFSVVAMAIPTFLVGVLPGYQVLGMMAPIALTILRMIQGLSVGGEYTTSIVFMVEHAPPGRRGLIGAVGCCGAIAGILLGSATGALLSELLPAETMTAWGWRLPFMFGLVVGVAGYFLRRHIDESAVPKAASRSPLRDTVRLHGPLLMRLAGLSTFNAVGFYLLFVYIVSWLQLADGIAPAHALEINSLSMLVLLPWMIAMGALSDKVGRKPVLLAATVIAVVSAVPLFWLMHHDQPAWIQLGQLGFVLSVGMFLGAQPTLMVEEVPVEIRCTAIALGYNVTLGIVGGLSPLVATWLVQRTQDEFVPAYMVMLAAAISFLSILSFRERSREPLEAATSAPS
ncbi:MAG TPA: MFS transporter [Reyranella sp.]|nr:MFS transporter [Reyranella sp.]